MQPSPLTAYPSWARQLKDSFDVPDQRKRFFLNFCYFCSLLIWRLAAGVWHTCLHHVFCHQEHTHTHTHTYTHPVTHYQTHKAHTQSHRHNDGRGAQEWTGRGGGRVDGGDGGGAWPSLCGQICGTFYHKLSIVTVCICMAIMLTTPRGIMTGGHCSFWHGEKTTAAVATHTQAHTQTHTHTHIQHYIMNFAPPPFPSPVREGKLLQGDSRELEAGSICVEMLFFDGREGGRGGGRRGREGIFCQTLMFSCCSVQWKPFCWKRNCKR